MGAIVAVFFLSLALALLLTPLAGKVGKSHGLLDIPSGRKVHRSAVPRTGGMAIFGAFFLPLLIFLLHPSGLLELADCAEEIAGLAASTSLAFALGFLDDWKGLGARSKFLVQAVAGLIAYLGGLKISVLFLPWGVELNMGWASLPATLFWFLLVMNAINLIDGLDGLAAGVSFFAAMTLLIFCCLSDKLLVALGLAAMGGACLGFLRYNFSPASIFMGDGGSYFLGCMLAGLSIMGSIKSQAAAAMLIPVVALGLPLMDALWAPIRRFVLGRGPFQPDRNHLHHKLLELGLSTRHAVIVLYGITIALGILAIVMVRARNSQTALLLILIGVAAFLGIRQLWRLDVVTTGDFMGWIRDVADELGMHKDRRRFLGWQTGALKTRDLNTLWDYIVQAGTILDFDFVALRLEPFIAEGCSGVPMAERKWKSSEAIVESPSHLDASRSLHLGIPLQDSGCALGSLTLVKDAGRSPMTPIALRRIEQLRRTVTDALVRLRREEEGLREKKPPGGAFWGAGGPLFTNAWNSGKRVMGKMKLSNEKASRGL